MSTVYLQEKIGNHLLRNIPYPAPSGLYIALFTVMPDIHGNNGTEVAQGGYSRTLIVSSLTSWSEPVAGNGLFKNAVAVAFGVPTENWGTIVGSGAYNTQAGGNLVLKGLLDTPQAVNVGFVPVWTIENLRLQMI